PDLVQYGSKPMREIAARPEFSQALRRHLWRFEEASAYLPHQVFIGAERPEVLAACERPWVRHPAAPTSTGARGRLVEERDFYAALWAADVAHLLEVEADWQEELRQRLQAHPLMWGWQPPPPSSQREATYPTLPLWVGEERIGAIRGDHPQDESLTPSVLLENLASKASGALAVRELQYRHPDWDWQGLPYLLGTGEEAVGDRYQRGGGNLAKAVAEMAGLSTASGADIKALCAAPHQAIPTAAAILAVACNSDGSQVAVAHADQTLRSYTPAGGWLAEQIALPAVPAAAAWAAGHESVLVACADQQLRLVPLALRRLFAAHDSAITGLCCLADADRLATCGEDGSVRLWNSATGEQLAVWRVSGGGPVACVAAEQGQVAAAAGQSVFVWNAADPAAQAVVLDLPTIARALSFTPGGNYLAAACENGEILRFDMASRQLLERCLGHSGPVHALAHAAERETLLSGGQDGLAYVWKPAGRAAVTVSKQPIVLLAVGDDQHVVAAAADGALSAWGPEGLAPSWQHAPQDVQGTPPRALAASQAGTVVFATQQRAQLLETGTGKLLAELELPEPPTAAALGRQQLIMAFASGVLRSYEVHAQRGGWQIEPAYDLQGLAQPAVAVALAEASHALYAAGGEPALRRWFAPSLSPRLVLADRPAPVQAVALNAQGTRLAVAEGAEVGLYDTAEGRALARCAGHDGPVWGLAFQPGGERLASAGRDGQLRLWDPNGNQLAVYTDPSPLPLYSVAWRADGMRLAAAGAARQWFVLEPGAQEPLLRGHGHNDTVYRVAFNPAGNRLATVDFSGGLCIWDANDGRLLFHQQLPATTVWSLAYTPDGRELAVGTQDPRLIVLAIPQ
ncbi:MAG: hypothetical protein K6T86_18030, partial [Pirellulales bacterium]|nr:hypothetical protein [Pirellulales bacterium]